MEGLKPAIKPQACHAVMEGIRAAQIVAAHLPDNAAQKQNIFVCPSAVDAFDHQGLRTA